MNATFVLNTETVLTMNFLIFLMAFITVIELNFNVNPKQQFSEYFFLLMIYVIPVLPGPLLSIITMSIIAKIMTHFDVQRLEARIEY